MVQVGYGAGLTRETMERLRIIDIPRTDRFDRDELSSAAMPREVDRSHSALSDLADQLVFVF
jgi:hypothetical protein